VEFIVSTPSEVQSIRFGIIIERSDEALAIRRNYPLTERDMEAVRLVGYQIEHSRPQMPCGFIRAILVGSMSGMYSAPKSVTSQTNPGWEVGTRICRNTRFRELITPINKLHPYPF
jgi:hypothetical protein